MGHFLSDASDLTALVSFRWRGAVGSSLLDATPAFHETRMVKRSCSLWIKIDCGIPDIAVAAQQMNGAFEENTITCSSCLFSFSE